MKKFLTLLLLFVCSCAYGIEKNDVINFLANKTSQEVQQKFVTALSKNNNAPSWLIEHDGVIYSLYAENVKKDKDSYMQNSLNSLALRTSSIKAASNLAIYLDNGRTSTKNFENKNAVEHVLRTYYEARVKFNSANKIINGIAFSLVWANKINFPMTEREFNENYCTLLYDQANEFFTSGKFPEALSTFHEIHYKAWANISAYLGASYCFLQMNQKDDAAKLTLELINSLSKDMTADEFASAGKILFTSGLKDEGFNAMEQAYKLLRTK